LLLLPLADLSMDGPVLCGKKGAISTISHFLRERSYLTPSVPLCVLCWDGGRESESGQAGENRETSAKQRTTEENAHSIFSVRVPDERTLIQTGTPSVALLFSFSLAVARSFVRAV